MRKIVGILVLLFFILSTIHIPAQTFSLEQLKSFNALSMADFKKEMKKLNYTFYDKVESSEYSLYQYDSPGYQSKIGKFEFTATKSEDCIEYELPGKKEYEQYLKLVLKEGYKEAEKGKIITKEPYVDYYKNKDHIRMVLPKQGETAPYIIMVFR
ncbi:hypothetical protein M9991_09520 [Chryseobacterium gallinarum]|uniref:hypothetical protein n=1 Tax=Chryseobacterium gallinarum TaxID=1324352 RepID=UPI002023DE07|nr:hypothetical protein [Chryseobacterium gallinarum]MCL8537099.1 hypothetical protein [Chryseobacterium gallinarum]